MATTRTISSPQIHRLCQLHAADKQVILIPCPGLAEQVESGELDHDELPQYLSLKLRPALEQGADTLVLGCTHYPFLLPQIQAIVGSSMHIIEPSEAVAAQVQRKLLLLPTNTHAQTAAQLQVWTSAPHNKAILKRYLQTPTAHIYTLPAHLLPPALPTHASSPC